MGVGVVLGQAADVVLQSVDAGRGDDPRLAHRAAELVLEAQGFGDEAPAARQHPAHGGAEALAQIDPSRVIAVREGRRRLARRHHGVHQAGAVHVRRQPLFAGHVGHRIERVDGPHRTAADVGGVLHGDQARALGMGRAVAHR